MRTRREVVHLTVAQHCVLCRPRSKGVAPTRPHHAGNHRAIRQRNRCSTYAHHHQQPPCMTVRRDWTPQKQIATTHSKHLNCLHTPMSHKLLYRCQAPKPQEPAPSPNNSAGLTKACPASWRYKKAASAMQDQPENRSWQRSLTAMWPSNQRHRPKSSVHSAEQQQSKLRHAPHQSTQTCHVH